jgi:hypothetical protein
LPAGAFGVDAEWATGHWSVQGELQRFVMPYRVIPTFHEQAGYAEVRRVLNPRWFIAERSGYVASSAGPSVQEFEGVAGFRPDSRQIIKVGYGVDRTCASGSRLERMFEVQVVTTMNLLSVAGK